MHIKYRQDGDKDSHVWKPSTPVGIRFEEINEPKPIKVYTPEERKALEEQLKMEGRL